MSSIYSIYKATNTINGKVYIGFDSKWPKRQIVHKSNHKKVNYKFYNAIRKYGWDNFEWTLIYQSKDREHTLKIMEPHFIQEYDTFVNGYNSTLGGEGVFGLTRKQSDEEKKKRSIFMKGNQLGKLHKGKLFSEERKQLLRKPKKLVTRTCPHCNFIGSGSNMFRYHFDKCKLILQSCKTHRDIPDKLPFVLEE
jgi:group I intron endonuclease